MRTIPMIAVGALLLVSAASAQEQQQAPASAVTQTATPASSFTPKLGQFDFGFRADDVSGNPARYQRFRDLRQGAVVNMKMNKETDTWVFAADAFNVGYRDQSYGVSFATVGKLTADFQWNQIPLYSADEQKTLYSQQGSAMLIDDPIQAAIQGATALGNPARDAALNAAFANAATNDLRSRRDIGSFNLAYAFNRDVDFKFDVKNTRRTGSQVMAFGFGTSPGLNPAVEFGVPLDDRTTDINGKVEVANTKGLLSVGYTGSWFNQNLPFVQFDNPLRATPINNGPSVGQLAWWPANSSYAINANGAYMLAPRTRASLGVSIGRWSQNEALPPATINAALTDPVLGPRLERTVAETEADIKSVVFNLNSRPNEMLWLNAKYRYYDYANQTPLFESVNAVVGDWGYGTQVHETEPASFTRKTLDLDASLAPLSYLSFNAGYTREDGDRTYRIYEKTEENTFRVSADSTGNQYVGVRIKYRARDADRFRVRGGAPRRGRRAARDTPLRYRQPQARSFHHHADRDADRPAGAQCRREHRQRRLRRDRLRAARQQERHLERRLRPQPERGGQLRPELRPRESTPRSRYSRTANPLSPTDTTFLDPTRDWTLDQDDTVKTFTASLDLMKALPKTDIRLSYDLSDGEATYVYGGPATTNPAIFSTTPLRQLLPVTNKLTDLRADLQHFVRPNVALGVTYLYEEYKVEDFALSETTINAPNPVNATTGVFASTIYSGYLYRPYKGNNFTLRMTYLW